MSVEIEKWSGIWHKDDEWRAGVRLVDGRDALLTAKKIKHDNGEYIEYGMIVQGEETDMDIDVPDELHQLISNKIIEAAKSKPIVTLKNLELF